MADNEIRYLFVKNKKSNEKLAEPTSIVRCKCNNKAEINISDKSKHKVKRDSKIVNTTVDQEYDMLVQTLSLIVKTMKVNRNKKRRKYKVYRYCRREILNLINTLHYESSIIDGPKVRKPHSSPVVKSINNAHTYKNPKRTKSYSESENRINFNTDFIVNSCCKTCDVPECINPFINPLVQARVYRCQKNMQHEKCCCACNSDAMFEVMKTLYDCYKTKNCDNCDCIMCGNLPVKELKAGEFKKSGIDVGVTASTGARKKDLLEKAKAEGLLTPLEGKTQEQKENILKGLAKAGLPMPEGKSESEKKLIRTLRADIGLPPEPRTEEEREKYAKALAAGIITPLEGKTPVQKENILNKMAQKGIPLPEGRTPSEKALVAKLKATTTPKGKSQAKKARGKKVKKGTSPLKAATLSEKLQKARAEGLLTPLDGKSTAQKEKIVRGLAKAGLPLPEGKSPSEKKMVQKVRNELGLPTEPKTPSEKERIDKAHAAGIITPLEGKSAAQKQAVLRKMADAGVPLPDGRSPSEKALVAQLNAEKQLRKIASNISGAKIPSEKLRKARAEGLLTPLDGKTQAQKEKILRGLVKLDLPLPDGKTASEKKLIKKIALDLGLPPAPQSPSQKRRIDKAYAAGLITSLEGKTPAQKEALIKKMIEAGIPLPEGRTQSEKALILKVKADVQPLKEAKSAGSLTSLSGKTPAQKEKILKELAISGKPLPDGKTASEKKLLQKIMIDVGLPPAPQSLSEKRRIDKAYAAGIITPLEGKTPAQKAVVLKKMVEAGIPLPEGRTKSEKALIIKVIADVQPLKEAKSTGSLKPLDGKTPAQKEKILIDLVKSNQPLPGGKTASEKKLIHKIIVDYGLPPAPQSPSQKRRIDKAYAAGIITPLEGKTPAQKAVVLKKMVEAGIPLPEGRSNSEKALIIKIKADVQPLQEAKSTRSLKPLDGKTPAQKQKILIDLVKSNQPLPGGKTASEKKLIHKIIVDFGLPPAPQSPSQKRRIDKAYAAGIITPLEGKTPAQKAEVLKKMVEAGVPLPEGRTNSEKELIIRIKADVQPLKEAKSNRSLKPLDGKTPAQKQKILIDLVKSNQPLPGGKTASEKKLIHKIIVDYGLPPAPQSPSQKRRIDKAYAAGIITPLEGKTPAQKAVVLKKMVEAGIPLPEGRTNSEKALIIKIKADVQPLKEGKSAGSLTPLAGKTPAQKEKILKELAISGKPLPDGKTASEKKLIQKIIKDLGLPPAAKSSSEKRKIDKARAAGIITPLEGKTPAQKEVVIKKMIEAGIPLPQGRTKSEKALITKIKADVQPLKEGKSAGSLTTLAGKTPAQKEKILKELAISGKPLPDGKTASEKKLIQKIIMDLGLPPAAKSSSEKRKIDKARAAGIITPLEGKTHAEKEVILKKMVEAGIPLPEGRTNSEKALMFKLKADAEKMKEAKATGLLTPLDGKTTAQKETILKRLIDAKLPLPEGKTQSEKMLINKIRAEAGVPPVGVTLSEKELIRKAKADGLFTPLTGKTQEQKTKIVKGLLDAGLPVPDGKTSSEKKLIKKLRAEAGLPPKRTLSENLGKIKKTGEAGKGLGLGESKYEEIVKTSKCDRSCGCENRKIRFKHSYVKIRVTSPDMASLCPCPVECVPGVKNGIIIDNEGIKVTVGTAIGVPNFSIFSRGSEPATTSEQMCMLQSNSNEELNDVSETFSNCTDYPAIENIINANYFLSSHKTSLVYAKPKYIVNNMEHKIINHRSQLSEPCLAVLSNHSMSDFVESTSAESILLMDSYSSITYSKSSTDDLCANLSVISYIALASGNLSTNSCVNNHYDNNNNEETQKETHTNKKDYSSQASTTNNATNYAHDDSSNDIIVLRFSDRLHRLKKNISFKRNIQKAIEPMEAENTVMPTVNKKKEPIVVINDLNSSPMTSDIMKKLTEILAAKPVNDDSSVYVLVPTEDDGNNKDDSNPNDSTVGIQISDDRPQPTNESDPLLKPLCEVYKPARPKVSQTSRGIKFCTKGKAEKFIDFSVSKSKHRREDNTNSEREISKFGEIHKKANTLVGVESHIMNSRNQTETFANVASLSITNLHDKTSERCAETRKLQVMFDDLGFDERSAHQRFPPSCGIGAIDSTEDRPCFCRPQSDEEHSNSTSPESSNTYNIFTRKVASSPTKMNQPHTTDVSHQTFSSLCKSPEASSNEMWSHHPKFNNTPCYCPPKNKAYFSPSLHNHNDKFDPYSEVNSQLFMNQMENTVGIKSNELLDTYSYRALHDITYSAPKSNFATLLDTPQPFDQAIQSNQQELTKIPIRKPNTLYPPACRKDDIAENAMNIPFKPSTAPDNTDRDHTVGALPHICYQGIQNEIKAEQQPVHLLANTVINNAVPKNPYNICPPTCNHVKSDAIQSNDPAKQTGCIIPNKIYPPMHTRIEKDNFKLPAQYEATTNQNIKEDQYLDLTHKKGFCRPTCSGAKTSPAGHNPAPPNAPFYLVPLPLSVRAPGCDPFLNSENLRSTPLCGGSKFFEALKNEQKTLRLRKLLRDAMGDAWCEPEPGSNGVVLVIGDDTFDEPVDCVCDSSKKNKGNKNDCACNTSSKSNRKKKCRCSEFVPPPPKLAPDLPPLPRLPMPKGTQTDESLAEKSSINLREQIMLQTEQTQTLSGFKVSNRAATKDYSYKEGDLFYDDALAYFEGDIPPEIEVLFETGPWERPPGYRRTTGIKADSGMSFAHLEGHDACSCEDRETYLKETMCPEEIEEIKKNHKCECPLKSDLPPEEPPVPVVNEPLSTFVPEAIRNGLKFVIGGKGSGSKGLTGICCFDMSIDTKMGTEILSDNDYIIYTD